MYFSVRTAGHGYFFYETHLKKIAPCGELNPCKQGHIQRNQRHLTWRLLTSKGSQEKFLDQFMKIKLPLPFINYLVQFDKTKHDKNNQCKLKQYLEVHYAFGQVLKSQLRKK